MAVMTWQPIETAPRDDRRVILWRRGYAEPMVVGYGSDWEGAHVAACSGHVFVGATDWMPIQESPC